jgi:hypothetical protein
MSNTQNAKLFVIGGIGFFGVGVGADDKIAVKLIKWVLEG